MLIVYNFPSTFGRDIVWLFIYYWHIKNPMILNTQKLHFDAKHTLTLLKTHTRFSKKNANICATLCGRYIGISVGICMCVPFTYAFGKWAKSEFKMMVLNQRLLLCMNCGNQ